MTNEEKKRAHKEAVAAAQLLRKIEKAQKDFQIFEPDDAILVAVSGGKDSLSLLQLLVLRSIYLLEKPKIVPVHVIGNYSGEPEAVSDSLVSWIANLGLELIAVPMSIPTDEPLPMNCSRCSRNRKRTLFEMAEQLGCNKVAFGHNIDDFAETAFMNLLTQGRLEAMPVVATYFNRFKLIRPLVYLSEKKLKKYAKLAMLPVIENTCTLAESSHRAKARQLLQQIKAEFPNAISSIYRAAVRINSD